MLDPGSFSPLQSALRPGDASVDLRALTRKPGWLVRYGVAIAVILAAFLLRFALVGDLDNRLPFAFFLPAVMVAAWFGGLGPGMLAVATSLLLGDYFFLPPHYALGPVGNAERTAIAVFAMTATLSVFLIENLHGRIRGLERALTKLASDTQQQTAPQEIPDRETAC